MKYKARHYKVDFRKDSETRWDELLTDVWARGKARTLCRAVRRQIGSELGLTTTPISFFLATAGSAVAWLSKGELDYLDDMKSWAEWAVGDFNQVLLANFSYELHQTRSGLGFCTSVAFLQPALGMVHCRNLDWPLSQIKDATIVLDCKSYAGPFKAVTVPGMVGVLSGVAKGRFSITVNSKEDRNHYLPNPGGWGATLLIRWILESCGDWGEALRELKKAPAFVPFYVTLVGCNLVKRWSSRSTRAARTASINRPAIRWRSAIIILGKDARTETRRNVRNLQKDERLAAKLSRYWVAFR